MLVETNTLSSLSKVIFFLSTLTQENKMFATRVTSFILVPLVTVAGYATYVRSQAQPAQAYSRIGADASGLEKWRKLNNGLTLVDVGRSGGGF